jgi:hypothetical protein
MSFQNVVRLSQIKKFSLPDYAHVNKVSKNEKNMRINVIQHDDSVARKRDARHRRLFKKKEGYVTVNKKNINFLVCTTS